MILWCDGPHEASENMRRDAGLLEAIERGAWPGGAEPAEPVLRLFGFVPPGITLGHSQRAEHELDLARCRADGVTWARRPTGGRDIFHSEEWTYSLAAPIADPDWGGALGESYARVSRLILASLGRLGAAPLERWAESLLADLPAGTRLVRTPPEGWRLTLDGSESAPYTPSVRN